MLLGTYQAKFAAGHRVAVPSSLRKDLGENYILAKWYEECLVLVSKSSWDALLTRITGGQNLITAPIRGSEHFIFASAYEIEPDDQGRIVVPERLITYAGLGEDIYFLGVRDRVEIWDKSIWDEKEKMIAKEATKYIEELSKNEKR
jgi:MraZ protein